MQGKDLDVSTNAATVRQLLSAMGIEPDGDDRVAPPSRPPFICLTGRTSQIRSGST
jgi:uncharacterized protein YabE (DUF348 family)